jgi:hypothetical protein
MEHALFITKISDLKYWTKKYIRLYYGNEFCQTLLPTKEDISNIIEFIEQNNTKLTFVTPFVTNEGIDKLRKIFDILSKSVPSSEIVVNDFGVLNMLNKHFNFSNLILGRLLNKQKRGPRILNFLDKISQESLEHFRNNNTSASIYQDFLIKNKIQRIELDNLLHGILTKPSKLKKSLYIPYGYVTTTRYCLANGSKDKSKKEWITIFPCKKECQDFEATLTHKSMPTELYLKGNTQFFKNDKLPDNLESLGVDRIVHQPVIPI